MGTDVKPDEDHAVEKALRLFPYFDTWNRKTITDCCRLSKIKIIPPDGIVLDSEEQDLAGVHFIMDGTCKLIEHLSLVQKKNVKVGTTFAMFREKNISRQISPGDEPKYSSLLFNMESLENESEKQEQAEEEQCEEVRDVVDEKSEVADTHTTESVEEETNHTIENKTASEEGAKKDDDTSEVKVPSKFFQFYRRMLPYMSAKNRLLPETSSKVETHFLQIALVHKGCCLGLGENLRNRFLVSVTRVTCLVIPLQFLLQHNPNNIWNRVKQFLNDYLPNEDKVLSEFIINKKWIECKRKLVGSKGVKSSSQMSDVPISNRLNDANMRLDMFQRIFLQPP